MAGEEIPGGFGRRQASWEAICGYAVSPMDMERGYVILRVTHRTHPGKQRRLYQSCFLFFCPELFVLFFVTFPVALQSLRFPERHLLPIAAQISSPR